MLNDFQSIIYNSLIDYFGFPFSGLFSYGSAYFIIISSELFCLYSDIMPIILNTSSLALF